VDDQVIVHVLEGKRYGHGYEFRNQDCFVVDPIKLSWSSMQYVTAKATARVKLSSGKTVTVSMLVCEVINKFGLLHATKIASLLGIASFDVLPETPRNWVFCDDIDILLNNRIDALNGAARILFGANYPITMLDSFKYNVFDDAERIRRQYAFFSEDKVVEMFGQIDDFKLQFTANQWLMEVNKTRLQHGSLVTTTKPYYSTSLCGLIGSEPTRRQCKQCCFGYVGSTKTGLWSLVHKLWHVEFEEFEQSGEEVESAGVVQRVYKMKLQWMGGTATDCFPLKIATLRVLFGPCFCNYSPAAILLLRRSAQNEQNE
jgi:hypothetical protein